MQFLCVILIPLISEARFFITKLMGVYCILVLTISIDCNIIYSVYDRIQKNNLGSD